MRVRAKQTSSDRRDNYRGTHREHPVWLTKLIAATAIILDDENGSISVA